MPFRWLRQQLIPELRRAGLVGLLGGFAWEVVAVILSSHAAGMQPELLGARRIGPLETCGP